MLYLAYVIKHEFSTVRLVCRLMGNDALAAYFVA